MVQQNGADGNTNERDPDSSDPQVILSPELQGDAREALLAMLPLVYDELRTIADRELRHERPNHTLEPTALVHEAYLRLIRQRNVDFEHRPHVIGVAAQLMRRILVDHARGHQAVKRRPEMRRTTLAKAIDDGDDKSVDLAALDDALSRLAEFDEQQCRIVELRYFGGLTIEQSAEVLGISPATVKREWTLAKAWLRREMSPD